MKSSHGVSAWRLCESVAITETTRSAACNFQGQRTPIAAFINQMEPENAVSKMRSHRRSKGNGKTMKTDKLSLN
ncbi:hypothetical protein K0M31_003664 [Melipona bicolor]|uniref:Uncharacterized protein n=1 Tax=Melipona bicolor TaxID=60889 RepID=A0AA40FYC9_9HYME|nr:hypothetical protein K0M31_003664 [Melipona bicolor]